MNTTQIETQSHISSFHFTFGRWDICQTPSQSWFEGLVFFLFVWSVVRLRQSRSNELTASSGASTEHSEMSFIYPGGAPRGYINTRCAHREVDFGEPTSLWLSLLAPGVTGWHCPSPVQGSCVGTDGFRFYPTQRFRFWTDVASRFTIYIKTTQIWKVSLLVFHSKQHRFLYWFSVASPFSFILFRFS